MLFVTAQGRLLIGGAYRGEVVEWFKAAVLKTAEVQGSVGSNPTLSVAKVIPNQKVMRFFGIVWLFLPSFNGEL